MGAGSVVVLWVLIATVPSCALSVGTVTAVAAGSTGQIQGVPRRRIVGSGDIDSSILAILSVAAARVNRPVDFRLVMCVYMDGIEAAEADSDAVRDIEMLKIERNSDLAGRIARDGHSDSIQYRITRIDDQVVLRVKISEGRGAGFGSVRFGRRTGVACERSRAAAGGRISLFPSLCRPGGLKRGFC